MGILKNSWENLKGSPAVQQPGQSLAELGQLWSGTPDDQQAAAVPAKNTYQPDDVSLANAQKKAAFLKELINQAPTYSAQQPYINEYYNLISDLYPSRSQRMSELGSVGDTAGVNQLVGMNEQQLLNSLNAQRFSDEFSTPTGSDELDQRNAELMAKVMSNPDLANQYYGEAANPNLIDQVTGRIESILPGKKNTYENIMREKRLSDAGLPYKAQYSGQ